METAFASLTTAFDWMLGNFTEMAEQLLSTPLFLIPLGIFTLGATIGLVRRLV